MKSVSCSAFTPGGGAQNQFSFPVTESETRRSVSSSRSLGPRVKINAPTWIQANYFVDFINFSEKWQVRLQSNRALCEP